MKLHILSDLHFEFGKWPKSIDINAINADVTVLAGDISVGLEGIQWALSIKRPVVYVMGNHEFFGQRPMKELWRKAKERVAGTHVHLLENDSLLLDDPDHPGEKVRFLGATLWTDFCVLGAERQEECMAAMEEVMTDYQSIFVSRRGPTVTEPGFTSRRQGDRLTVRNTLALHHESRDYLTKELRNQFVQANTQTRHKTVVVTHHAPSARSLQNQKATALSDSAFASHLDALIAHADLWIHGHTHIPVDYQVTPCKGRIVSNPRGYAGREPVLDFDPTYIVTI